MNLNYRSLLLTIALLYSAFAFSQKDDDYKKSLEAVKKEIWGWNIPAFSNKTIPAEYANEPGVVLARHQEIKAIVNSGGRYKEMVFVNTFREQVKINDKATLDDYSEFSYRKYRKATMFFAGRKDAGTQSFLGIRIIKPNGMVKEVDISEEVLTKDEKNLKESKVAIAGLEVGDIIDYFLSRHEEANVRYTTDPYLFVFGEEKPMLHYSIHCEFGEACAVEYRSMNGAPEFKVKKNANGDNILDAEVKNMAKSPVDLWMSPIRQLPILRLNVRVGGPKKNRRTAGEVYRNQDYMKIIEDVKIDMKDDFYGSQLGLGAYVLAGEIKSMIKRVRRDDDLPKDSLPYYIYYAFRYIAYYKVDPKDPIVVSTERNYQRVNNKKFLLLLSLILDKLNIPNEIVLAASRYGPDAKQVMLESDFDYMIRTTKGTPIYMCADGVFTNCNYIESQFEGQTDPIVAVRKFSDKTIHLEDGESSASIPVSQNKHNVQIEKLKVEVTDNMEQLKINRQTVLKGHMRDSEQKRLILFEDSYDEERRALGIRESFMETFADSRRNRTLADEYTAAFAKARTDWKDQFMEEITETYDQKPVSLTQFKVDNMGLRHSRPDMVFSTEFTMDGWIKKGGNNYIVDVGKLIGSQLQLKPTQLERSVDVYMPFARSYEYIISMDIPAGYKAEGLDKLNISKTNESGNFTVETKQSDKLLQIRVVKTYARAFQKADRWKELVDIVNAANDFQSRKILLRKG